ncbi:ABC transporter substrate-binding protein [Myxococcus llanfairpwllgwyngyllgogerychwyrndrobwllllantysiliogogogochensis]|uniref:ABC transporter substrate-binding protein n=1 Tax=Myxococcus llanfairpwllgwyngyllgogerychwyrndrobwllllantysiliogogogochensis TaxID=2590453 RepID=A0A540WXW0_9BACT|nr:ABC transporter substrate-binding protein [Myxococcus llanfairpwllgwyngyllgogerychwyrndrobwllllantysiliogogogochensis]TQF13843.1 ABC transporter substrate-binding protein [Myxococcus llanfairpwllgwyngyllgogerychwyrndrobwllllantysiliogogogochensis]
MRSLLLLATLALALAGCEKKSAPTETPPTGQAGDTQAAGTQAGTPAQAPAGSDAQAAAPDSKGAILIGEVGSLTGSEATFGVSARNGIELALNEANAAGGVRGRPLAVRVYDSQGRPEEGAQAATRLITQDRVVAILGEAASSVSMAMAEKAQVGKVPMITPTSTSAEVTKKGDYIFRVCFIDEFQGLVMAKFARENLKLSKVAVLTDNKSAFSIGLAEVFTAKFQEFGGTIVGNESYSKGDTDFRAQLTALKQVKPEAVFVPGYYTDVGIIARQAREVGLKVPLLGGDGWDSDKLFELGGSALEGSYFSNHYSPGNPDPVLQSFLARYKEKYGSVPDSVAALSYDAARVLVEALKRAPDTSGPALRDAIAATKDFPGVAGRITLDANRDAVKEAVVLKVAGGKAEFVTTVKP